jgi:serine/threonine protein phosphatase PrpC
MRYFEEHKTSCETWSIEDWKEHLNAVFALAHSNIRARFVEESKSSNQANPRVVDEKGIVRSTAGDPVHGGSTATVVVCIRPDTPTDEITVITANCGDSTALCVRLGNNSPGETHVFLSEDHGPESDVEYKRVSELPEDEYPTKLLFVYDKTNVFRKFECPPVFSPNGSKDQKYVTNPWGNGLHPTNVRYEPAVYAVTPRGITKDSTCIAMTRALGDFYAHQFGLTSIPSIGVQTFPSDADYCLLAGSDGIWDCWRYEDFAQFVSVGMMNRRLSSTDLSEDVLNESIRRAVANFGSKHYDDASFVCWRLCPGARSEIEVRREQN